MQNFIKEKWIASWSAFSGFVQLRSTLEIFFCCTIMRPPTKLQVFTNFWPPKTSQPFITLRTLQIYFRQTIFSSQVENEVKRSPLCGCCWDPRSHNWWIKEGPKRGIFSSFSKTVRSHKVLYICQWSLFWIKKKVRVFLMCLRFLENISPKTFGPHCVFWHTMVSPFQRGTA